MIKDMHQKLSAWLSTHYREVLLPTFETSAMVARGPRRRISKATARLMMSQAHYKFGTLLQHQMATRQGRVVLVGEQYTSKTCSACGHMNETLGRQTVFRCATCGLVADRDVNAARNILHKNMELSALRTN